MIELYKGAVEARYTSFRGVGKGASQKEAQVEGKGLARGSTFLITSEEENFRQVVEGVVSR